MSDVLSEEKKTTSHRTREARMDFAAHRASYWSASRNKRVHCSPLCVTNAEATKKSADAATEGAVAAKKSADITAALHRPFMGLLSVTAGWSGRVLHAQFALKNYGTLSQPRTLA